MLSSIDLWDSLWKEINACIILPRQYIIYSFIGFIFKIFLDSEKKPKLLHKG